MKKALIITALLAGMAYAGWAQGTGGHKPAPETEVVFYSWDGTKALTDDDSLTLIVGETKELKYTVPVGVDTSRYTLSVASRNNRFLFVSGNRVKAHFACDGYVGFYIKEEFMDEAESQVLKVVKVSAQYRASGPLFDEGVAAHQVYYSIDADWRLQFWVEQLDSDKLVGNRNYYEIPDYVSRDGAPWYPYRDSIKEIVLNNIDRVGKFAFCDMSKIHYVQIMDNIKYLGDSVFYGCNDLTLEVNRYDPDEYYGDTPEESNPNITKTSGNSLTLGRDNYGDTIRPVVLIVSSSNYLYQTDALNIYSGATDPGNEWSKCGAVTAREGYVSTATDVHWIIGQSDSLGTVCLTIDNTDPSKPVGIPDLVAGTTYGWEEFGDAVKDLKISDRINYIGRYAFIKMSNLQSIQFNQNDHPLDSIHVDAFNPNIRPWKFAMGDPQDGALVPPKVIGYTADWRSVFSDSTVLYVPDSLMDDGKGGKVRCIDLYKADRFWGTVFHLITDRTVAAEKTDSSVLLSWLPLENATGYLLTVMELNCEEGTCDTASLFIPATGKRGVVDWANMDPLVPSYLAARRAPMEQGGGGLVLTISIQSGSGDAHDKSVETEVSGVKAKQDYAYTRIVQGNDTEKYNKAGAFLTPEQSATGLEENGKVVTGQSLSLDVGETVRVYDLLGRPVSGSAETLPDGLYILDNGHQRTTILLRR